jgi:hypothetical protein
LAFPNHGEKELGKMFVSRPGKHKLNANELGAKEFCLNDATSSNHSLPALTS